MGISCTWNSLQWRHNGRDGVANHQPHHFYSTVYSGGDQRKHQNSSSLAFVRGIHRWPVNSPHKWPVTREMFPFDDVIMYDLCIETRRMSLHVPLSCTWYFCMEVLKDFIYLPFPGAPVTLILPWISNYIHYDMLGEITYPFPNFTVQPFLFPNFRDVWEWIILHLTGCVIIHSYWD